MKTKKCTKCNIQKLLSEFHKRKHEKYNASGLSRWCKTCVSVYDSKYRKLNRIKRIKQRKEYYLKNQKKILKKSKIYRKTHKKEIHKYRKTHKESIKITQKIYKLNNSKKLKETLARYIVKNRLKINSRRRKYIAHKMKTDIIFRITNSLRLRIWNAIKSNIKSDKTIKLLGCDVEFLKGYLQSMFTLGMTWKNYGKWHIDHIKPCASFDLSKPEEQLKCFHYTNLQPLWAKDNIIKGAKLC